MVNPNIFEDRLYYEIEIDNDKLEFLVLDYKYLVQTPENIAVSRLSQSFRQKIRELHSLEDGIDPYAKPSTFSSWADQIAAAPSEPESELPEEVLEGAAIREKGRSD